MTVRTGHVSEPTVEVVRGRDRYRARCSCGWAGPLRGLPLTAEDDSARHLLDVTQ